MKETIRYLCMAILILIAFSQSKMSACWAQGYGTPGQDYNRGFTGGASRKPFFNGGYDNANNAAARRMSPQQQRIWPVRAPAGKSTMASLEDTMDAIDNSSGWSQTPISGVKKMPYSGARPSLSQNAPQLLNQRAVTGGNPMAGMFPRMTPQDLLRIFMEGGSPQMGGGSGGPAGSAKADAAAKTSTAYSNYQTAENEAAKALNGANIARNDSSKYNRQSAASSAEYAANNAGYAAQRAESAAYSGGSKAQGYASLARAAANRARQSANEARYNADTKQ